jgi:hypothetical protein
MSVLNRPYFRDEESAHAFLESILWPDGAECPHCGVVGTAYPFAVFTEIIQLSFGLTAIDDLQCPPILRKMRALLAAHPFRILFCSSPQEPS